MSATEQEVVENAVVDADDAAFAAGFAEARGDEPPAEAAPSDVTEPVAEEAPAENLPEAEAKAETLIAGLTESQLKELLIKAGEVDSLKLQIEKSFGKVGELNRTLQQLQARTEAGEPVELTEEDVADLANDFPELAQAQLNVLRKFASKMRGTGTAAQPAIDLDGLRQQVKQEVTAEYDRKLEERLLNFRHPGWVQEVQSQDFMLWGQNQLGQDEFQQLIQSTDADFISSKLDAFKLWKDNAVKQTKQKQRRLESAITPRGDSTSPPTTQSEEDAFIRAFKAARG